MENDFLLWLDWQCDHKNKRKELLKIQMQSRLNLQDKNWNFIEIYNFVLSEVTVTFFSKTGKYLPTIQDAMH